MIRAGAGIENSWSWTESNFHPDDAVGNSYTDPMYTPSYSLDGYSDEDIYAGMYNVNDIQNYLLNNVYWHKLVIQVRHNFIIGYSKHAIFTKNV